MCERTRNTQFRPFIPEPRSEGGRAPTTRARDLVCEMKLLATTVSFGASVQLQLVDGPMEMTLGTHLMS